MEGDKGSAPAAAPPTSATPPRRRFAGLRFALLVALIGAVFTTVWATGAWESLHPERVRELQGRSGAWGPAFFIGLYAVASFAFIPRGVLALGAGAAFGWPAAAYTYAGALVGESLAFGAARWLGRGFVEAHLGGTLRRWDRWLGEAGFQTVLVLRLMPVVPCDAINYGAGLGSIGYRHFIAATALGIVPGCLLYAAAGDGLFKASPLLLVFGFGGLATMALVGAAWQRRRRRKQLEADGGAP